jgi:hypothetical protein
MVAPGHGIGANQPYSQSLEKWASGSALRTGSLWYDQFSRTTGVPYHPYCPLKEMLVPVGNQLFEIPVM